MSAEQAEVAATTEGAEPEADAKALNPKSAESAPAVVDTDEDARELKTSVGKRIDELTRRRYDAERERDHWRDMALKSQPPPQAKVEEASQGKTLADFGYDEAKFAAYWREETRKEAASAAREEYRKSQTTEYDAQRDEEFAERETDFAKDLPDYMEVTRDQSLPITEAMAETIKDSENGPAISYHLGKNPRLAAQIARLPPLQQAREIGRIEATLANKPVVPKVSAAPPPAPKIAAGDSKTDKDPVEMSPAEFAKWRARYKKR
ncbi:MAG TPA: hypothetical protein VK626_01575 [Nitrospiraceae bacterium]|nr:hypothetical protein [Nitrospiraceae bacterium]